MSRGRSLQIACIRIGLTALVASGCGVGLSALDGAVPQTPTSLPAAFVVRDVRLPDGSFQAQVRAPGEAKAAGTKFVIGVEKRSISCEVFAEPWSLATKLDAAARMLRARGDVAVVRTAARLGNSGRPYLVAEVLYGPKDDPKGIAQLGIFGSAEGTVSCSTEGPGRVAEIFAMIEDLSESQSWNGESGREKPLYAETNTVFLGDVPVGFEYRYLRRAGAKGGLSWFKIRGLAGRVGEAGLTTIDDVTIERLDEERNVRELHVMLKNDGTPVYDLTVQRQPDGALVARGILSGQTVSRELAVDKPIASDLSLAPLFQSLSEGKVARVSARRVHIEGTSVTLSDQEFVRATKGRLRGPGGHLFHVDERGFIITIEEDAAGEVSPFRVERSRIHGAIPR